MAKSKSRTMSDFMTFKDRRGNMRLNIRAVVNAYGYEQAQRKMIIWGYGKKDVFNAMEFLFK